MHRYLTHPGFIEAFARGCNWATYLILAMWLEPAQYGAFSFVLAMVLLVSALGTAGQDRTVLRYIGDANTNVASIFSASLIILLPAVLLFCVLAYLGLTVFEMRPMLLGADAMIVVWVGLQSLYLLLVSMCRGLNKRKSFMLIRAGYGASKLIGMSVIAATTASVVNLIAFEVTLLGLFGAGVLFASRGLITLKAPTAVFRKALLFGSPLVLHILAGATLGQIDKMMIGHFLSEADLGLYAFLNSIAGGVFFVFAVINIVYEAKVYQLGNTPAAEALMRRMFLMAFAAAVVLLVGANLVLPWGLTLMDKSEYYDGAVMLTLSLAYLIYPLYLQGNIRFALKEKTGHIPLMTGVAATLNVALNLVLLPKLGIIGAAYSTLAAYIVLVILAQWMSRSV